MCYCNKKQLKENTKDVTIEDVTPILEGLVKSTVAELPVPKSDTIERIFTLIGKMILPALVLCAGVSFGYMANKILAKIAIMGKPSAELISQSEKYCEDKGGIWVNYAMCNKEYNNCVYLKTMCKDGSEIFME